MITLNGRTGKSRLIDAITRQIPIPVEEKAPVAAVIAITVLGLRRLAGLLPPETAGPLFQQGVVESAEAAREGGSFGQMALSSPLKKFLKMGARDENGNVQATESENEAQGDLMPQLEMKTPDDSNWQCDNCPVQDAVGNLHGNEKVLDIVALACDEDIPLRLDWDTPQSGPQRRRDPPCETQGTNRVDGDAESLIRLEDPVVQ
ncbi:MAG: hypothetical protein Q9187_005309 [Circinaria calcarea]